MNEQDMKVSVLDPISPAIERVKTILFRPFDLGKWFVIGFCAWLACLGSGPRGNFNFNYRPHHELERAVHEAKEFVAANLAWIIPAAVVVVLLIVGIGLVITWLNSRGRFMFLHCVALDKAEIKNPWTKFGRHGNSLFLFRIVMGLIGAAMVLPCIAAIVIIVAALSHRGPNIGVIAGAAMFVLIIIAISVVFLLIEKFTMDFVVPIMFLRTTSCVTAWREFLTVLSANKGRFVLYILFQILIGLCVGVIVIGLICVTCCCAACILAIPYIGTVLVLPLIMFQRAYSLYYLRQFGPRFDVFSA
jgi:hypothetical protein